MKDTAALHDEIALLREQLAAKEHLIKAEQVKLAERDKKITERDAKIAELKEQLKYLLNRRYGPSSEKTSPDQLGLFNEAEAIIAEVEPEPSTPEYKGSSLVIHRKNAKRPKVASQSGVTSISVISTISTAT